jgi:hypothetical protein
MYNRAAIYGNEAPAFQRGGDGAFKCLAQLIAWGLFQECAEVIGLQCAIGFPDERYGAITVLPGCIYVG